MFSRFSRASGGLSLGSVLLFCTLGSLGCTGLPNSKLDRQTVRASSHRAPYQAMFDNGPIPRELELVSLPEYVIEPPDIVRIDALRVIPKGPYKVESLDGLYIQVANVLEDEPISNVYVVEPDGTINLGPKYGGTVKVLGMTINQVRDAIENHLKANKTLNPKAVVSLAQSKALQQIRGEHLVQPDGTVVLGTYGAVRVVGLNVTEARQAIEAHLSRFLQSPEISLQIAAFNSKVFYVIFDGGGRGQQVIPLPITGKDTVLDAISKVYGLSPVSSKHRMTIARPAPAFSGKELILPVDWEGISMRADTITNYQLLPGDRLYVKANRLIEADTLIAQMLSPFERIFGFTLLGNGTIRALDGQMGGGGGGGF
jgi:polysaccharide export outer membrane protein